LDEKMKINVKYSTFSLALGFLFSYVTHYYFSTPFYFGYHFGFPIGYQDVNPCLIPPCPEIFSIIYYIFNSIFWIIIFNIIYFLTRAFKKKG